MSNRILGIRVGLSGNHSSDEFTSYSRPAAERVAKRDAQEASKRVEKTVDPWEKLYYLLEARGRLGDKTSPYVKVDDTAFQKDIKELEELASKVSQDAEQGNVPQTISPEKLLKIAEYLESSDKRVVAKRLYQEIQKRTGDKDAVKTGPEKKRKKIGRI